ncbi:EAL domain-containing protein [Chitinilyticum litopenaei]|uniref:EAL domain-containing protein n=1 Tax=Chitinilyticum litopenaei TaxID=1121276 RepID=UPI000426A5AF|nr:EAL domain-containing protein [Chitinilyticum litopenaei]
MTGPFTAMLSNRKALKYAVLYLLAGILWIVFSDQLLAALIPNLYLFTILSTWKGLAFVVLSALVVYLAARSKPAPRHLEPGQPGRQGRLLAVFLLLAGLVLVAGQASVARLSQTRSEELLAKVKSIGEYKVRQMERILARNLQNTEAMRGELASRDFSAMQGAEAEQLLARLDDWARLYGYRSVLVLRRDGSALAGTGLVEAGMPASLLQRAQASEAPVFSSIWRNEGDGSEALGLAYASGFTSRDGQALVLVVVDDPYRELFPLLQEWPIPSKTAEGYLFERSGAYVRYLSPLRHDPARPLSKQARIDGSALQAAQFLRGEVQTGQMIEGRDYRGEPVVGFASALPGSPWFMIAKIDRAELYAGASESVSRTTMVYGLMLLLLGSALYGLLQRQALRQAQREQEHQEELLGAMELLDRMVEAITEPIFAKDNSGRYILLNAAAAEVIGKPEHEALGKTDAELFPPAVAQAIAADDAAIRARGGTCQYEETLVDADGRERIFHTIKGVLHDAQGQISGVFGAARDISRQKQTENHLRLMAAVFENIQDGVMITDLSARILAVNRAFTTITGYAEAEVLGQTPRVLQSGRQGPEFYAEMRTMLQEQGSWQGEIWNRRKNGEVYPEWLRITTIHDAGQQPMHYLGVFSDISQIKRSEAELAHLANYDLLTDLPNRQLIMLQLAQLMRQAERHEQQLAVLLVDLDEFKTVNDSLGHQAGDELLLAVAKRLRAIVRASDLLGRLGGDEFLLIAEIREAGEAALIAQEILLALSHPYHLQDCQEVSASGSIGISIFPDDGDSAGALLRGADAAMFEAKHKGRHQFCYYTSALNAQAHAALQLEAALRHALEEEQFELYYQPKFALSDGHLCGAEALLRWRRADGQLISPADFIPVAERTGLILPIGDWVIDTACRQLRLWRDAGLNDFRLAINLSVRQLGSGTIHHVLQACIARHGVPASSIELEITESLMMIQPEETARLLGELKQAGFSLAIDDFGTGYSSLSYLVRFPVDVLKIDQSFVRDLPHAADAAALAGSIIAMAHTLQKEVVAEGVENREQLALLQQQGCDIVQGFYYHPPLPISEFATLLERKGMTPASIPSQA